MSKGRVLVVDDSALLRQVIFDTFTPHGYEVIMAGNGAEALERIKNARPDLILSDVLMPVMDGWALCQEIRSGAETRGIPFIFLSTERDVPKRIKGLELGADDYVCKPFSKEELFSRAEAVMRRARAASGPDKRGERAKNRASLAGNTSAISMADLLQLLSLNGRTGTLHVSGESPARIYFSEGQIIHAETQALKGEKALFRVMAWSDARFLFEGGEPEREIQPTLTGSTASMLMEGFAHMDEVRDLIARLPARNQRLRARTGMEGGPERADLNGTQRIMILAAGRRGARVADIIDAVPEKDLHAYATMVDLLDRGLLEVLEVETAS